jgi:hypothetical protein
MATATLGANKQGLLTRLLAALAIVGIYLFGSLATSGVVMTFGATDAEARGRRGRRGRSRGRSRSRRGRRGRSRRGRGIYFGGYSYGYSYCSIQRISCANRYGWGTRRWYNCMWRSGC